jgi:hypothetical protein
MEDAPMKESNLLEEKGAPEEEEEIEILLKPMNITAIHKKEVQMKVSRYQLVGDLAQTLINIMGVKEFSAADANFLYTGKVLDHQKNFEE